MIVPAGALSSNVPIAIALVGSGAPDLPDGVQSAGPTYALTPHGTKFAKPVTVSIPYDSVAANAGMNATGSANQGLAAAGATERAEPESIGEPFDNPGPMLLKTNAAGDWFELAGATITEGEDGVMFTAETSSFSYLTTATGPRRPNSSGLYRTWHFWGIPSSGNEATLVVPPPEEPTEDEVFVPHRYGPLPAAGFGDGFADAEVYSSKDGKTYWVFSEAPGDEPDGYTGSAVHYVQARSFEKAADDATLKFTITAVHLAGKNYGGIDLIPYECVGSPACELKLFGKIEFSAGVWASGVSQRNGRVELTTLSGPGFGYRIDEIERSLPGRAA